MCRVSVVSYDADQLDDLRLGVHEVRPAGQVDRRLHQRLVQRHRGVAEAADAGLVAERLAQRLAERERGVLDGVVRVDLEVAVGAHDEVEAAVLAELGEHVVEERHAGRDVGGAGAVEVELDRDVATPWSCARTRAVRLMPDAPRSAVGRDGVGRGAAQPGTRSTSSAVPAVTRSQPGRPDVADQDAAVEQRLPGRPPVGEARRTARSSRPSRRPRARVPRSSATSRSRWSLTSVDGGEQLVGVRERRQRGRLGERGQVVRQPHQLQRVDDRGVGGEVADPRAGERERLGHRAGHDQPRAAGQQAQRRTGSAENSAYASSTTTMPGASRRRPPRRRRGRARCRSGCSASTGTTTSGAALARPAPLRRRRRQAEVGASRRAGDPARSPCPRRSAGASSTSARSPARCARPAERLQQLLEDLVGAVGRPHLLAAVERRAGSCAVEVGGEVGRSAIASRSG